MEWCTQSAFLVILCMYLFTNNCIILVGRNKCFFFIFLFEYILHVLLFFSRSLMYIRNWVEPRTLPCSTPSVNESFTIVFTDFPRLEFLYFLVNTKIHFLLHHWQRDLAFYLIYIPFIDSSIGIRSVIYSAKQRY